MSNLDTPPEQPLFRCNALKCRRRYAKETEFCEEHWIMVSAHLRADISRRRQDHPHPSLEYIRLLQKAKEIIEIMERK